MVGSSVPRCAAARWKAGGLTRVVKEFSRRNMSRMVVVAEKDQYLKWEIPAEGGTYRDVISVLATWIEASDGDRRGMERKL